MGRRISKFLPPAVLTLVWVIAAVALPRVASAMLADSTAASLSPALPLDDGFHPNVEPDLPVRRAVGAIHVDGRLDEVAWRHAIRAGNFCQIEPPQAEPPEVGTEVLVTYDETRVYFAFKAWDNPRTVRVSSAARDSIQDDDWVGLLLDPFGDASWAYEIVFNACGTVSDGLWTAHGTDRSFDLVCEARGRVTNDGYQVEVAIPFTSLRLPERDVHEWRATFLRSHPRDRRREYSWAAIDRNAACFSCRFGTLTGIRAIRRSAQFNVLDPIPDIEMGMR
jgi:hypothetical protein